MLHKLRQGEMFEVELGESPTKRHAKKVSRSGAFTDNMKLPVHGWFRYSAGFSGEWAEEVIKTKQFESGEIVFDPFAGSGTTLIAAQKQGKNSAGVENHHFVHRVASAKLLWATDEHELLSSAERLLQEAKNILPNTAGSESSLIARCYTLDAQKKLEALKRAFIKQSSSSEHAELLWLAITAILRECSGVGTAQWQYLLPNKSKARISDPFAAFAAKVDKFASDMAEMKRKVRKPPSAKLIVGDAREIAPVSKLKGKVRLIVTSPPYPNNYDYADATRLEMTFWEEIKNWSDLHEAVRHRLVRSCSQHSAAEKLELRDLLDDPAIEPIRHELTPVCEELEEVRKTKGGKKTYHTMIAAYFVDLARTWKVLRTLCADGAEAYFVIGDSAPYGVYVPVDRWLGDLALAAGFKSYSFEKFRDRNTKWKNRKHRVPLKEGILRVEA